MELNKKLIKVDGFLKDNMIKNNLKSKRNGIYIIPIENDVALPDKTA